jgi:hypothetical protein
VTDGVDATMQDVKPLVAPPMCDRARPNAGTEELLPRDHAVLSLRKRGNHPIHMIESRFGPYSGPNLDLGGHGGEVRGLIHADGALR